MPKAPVIFSTVHITEDKGERMGTKPKGKIKGESILMTIEVPSGFPFAEHQTIDIYIYSGARLYIAFNRFSAI